MAKKSVAPPPIKETRAKVSQSEVPGASLEDALRVPLAIAEHYGYRATKPLHVAAAMGIQPNSGGFRMLAGAAIAYGLTSGGPNAPEIAITPLGMRIVRSTVEGDDLKAKREALLKPRVIGEFLRKYADAPIPRDDIGKNVLQDLGVPKDRAGAVLAFILEGATTIGLVKDIRGKKYISLDGVPAAPSDSDEDTDTDNETEDKPPAQPQTTTITTQLPATLSIAPDIQRAQKRVYITHGKNRAFVEPVKKLL